MYVWAYQCRFKVGSLQVGSDQGSFRFVSLQGSCQVPIPPHFLFALHADEFEDTKWVGGGELGVIYYVHV